MCVAVHVHIHRWKTTSTAATISAPILVLWVWCFSKRAYRFFVSCYAMCTFWTHLCMVCNVFCLQTHGIETDGWDLCTEIFGDLFRSFKCQHHMPSKMLTINIRVLKYPSFMYFCSSWTPILVILECMSVALHVIRLRCSSTPIWVIDLDKVCLGFLFLTGLCILLAKSLTHFSGLMSCGRDLERPSFHKCAERSSLVPAHWWWYTTTVLYLWCSW